MIEAVDIRVKGIVQGVGFRPFVYRQAKKHLVAGWVLNAVDGVHIHAEAERDLLDAFTLAIADEAPAAARVSEVAITDVPLRNCTGFEIRYSDDDATDDVTAVSPDLATCDECLAELFDPDDRRYRYPFINCTNCGPRFTIIRDLPYDRPATSMADFTMCDNCAAEYVDPENRRFHAQPDACWECGPHIDFSRADGPVRVGTTRAESDAIIDEATALLREGGIVAVKGLGGFHLVCDAENPTALSELRRRKHREGKAFAVMVADAACARRHVDLTDEERAVLESPARPIVLVRKRPDASFAAGLADGLPELGIMLPATPLQHLLVRAFDGMLVMTSGNVHDEPICIDDGEARVRLAGIADAFIGNDRAVLSRYDDSVVRVLRLGDDASDTAVQMIRRARGFAPRAIDLPAFPADDEGTPAAPAARDLFATGPEQKCTFCLTRGGQAYVGQHIGDMESPAAFDAWLEAKETYERLFRIRPATIVHDLHPEYLTSKWAAEQPEPGFAVQHHHAHIASVMAENGLSDAVCGIAFDGTGYGPDGAIWGGEVLLCNLRTYERFADFAYFPLPGGAAAIRNPLRCAYGALWAFDLLEHPAAVRALQGLGEEAASLSQMIERGINSPQTSSVGRLFDAASALLGLSTRALYEGEPAITLEAAITPEAAAAVEDEAVAQRYTVGVVKNSATAESTALDTAVVLFDAAPVFTALLDDVQADVDVAVIARRFHDAFVRAIVTAAQLTQSVYGLNTVALSGGVFMNRYLVEHAVVALRAEGFTVALNRELPPNDGCISFGQAVVASADRG